jgi:hypothetical protein
VGLTIGNRTNGRGLVVGGLACILLLPLGLAMNDNLKWRLPPCPCQPPQLREMQA